MLFNYTVLTPEGAQSKGQIDAHSIDVAISSLQRRGFVVVSVLPEIQKNFLQKKFSVFDRVPMKDVVIMSRQIAALFEAQVSAIKAFSMLAENSKNKILSFALSSIAQDIQGGITISQSMEKHQNVFTSFYVNMVRAGEESGKLNDSFKYLADYLEREYELTSKTKNALIYPAFVIVTFITVMVLMLTMIIPRLSGFLIETGQQLPIYTRAVIALSDFFVNYGVIFLIMAVIGGLYYGRLSRTNSGRKKIDGWKISLPAVGSLYKKVYLSRIADNLDTMLSSSIPVLRALEITGDVVGNELYKEIMVQAVNDVKAGISISSSFEKHEIIPPIMVQMVRVGEETGSLGSILKTLARFYKREVDGAVDTLIGLIEPIMIVGLGVGVGFLLTSILLPIYNIASSL
jgi:type IV pilus assembly protein PilC